MNKEQAIAALQVEQFEHEPGRDSYEVLNDAIEILCALPDDSPTVLARDGMTQIVKRLWADDPEFSHLDVFGAMKFIDALLALGPVVAEGPAQCPTKHGRTWNGGTANSMWPHGYISDYCPDCGTRLQGGEK